MKRRHCEEAVHDGQRWSQRPPSPRGVGERRRTVAAVGGGGGGAAKSTSNSAVADNSASPIGTGGDGNAMGRPHSTTGRGRIAVHP
jgi:hypothetical protein